MKVTFLTGEYPPMQGGIGDYTVQLAHHLGQNRVKPTVLINQMYRPSQSTASPSIPVYPTLHGWGVRCWYEIKQFLREHQPAVLHIQYQAAAFDLKGWVNWLPYYLRRWSDRPQIITTFHDLRIPYLFPKAGSLRWQSILALARHSDAVICTNREDMLTLQQQPWPTHIQQISLGNNIPVSPPTGYNRRLWRQQLALTDDDFVLAYFGFLNESKGGEDLIAVLAQLAQQGQNVRLLMIGGDVGDSDPNNQAYATRVRQMIAEYHLQNRLIFTGFVSTNDVSAHLLAADAALMPYRDGVSFRRTTLIAALQHGLPLVSTTPIIELPQIIPAENMLLAPPQDVTQLSQHVISLIEAPALRQRLSQGAKALGQQFDWSTIAAETSQLYRRVCQV